MTQLGNTLALVLHLASRRSFARSETCNPRGVLGSYVCRYELDQVPRAVRVQTLLDCVVVCEELHWNHE